MRAICLALALALALASVPATAGPAKKDSLYHYRAYIDEVVTGDSVIARIDLGFSIWKYHERLRLARIDAPKPHGATEEAGEASRDFLKALVGDQQLIINTIYDPDEPEGRFLVEIWLDESNVNDRLVAEGHAVYRDD